MSSGRGTDPGEPEAMHFAVTESLLGLGIIPQVHLGANLTMIETTRHTVIAIVETGESEPHFSLEIKKAELWRAVVLEDESGLGLDVPSANASRESLRHRRKLADLFLTEQTLPSGGGSFVVVDDTVARVSTSSLSPASAQSIVPCSGTPATSESRVDVVAAGVGSSPSVKVPMKHEASSASRGALNEARRIEDEDRGDRPAGAGEPAHEVAPPYVPPHDVRMRHEYSLTLTARALREEAELLARLDESLRKWQLLANTMQRAATLSRIRLAAGKVRRVEMAPTCAPVASAQRVVKAGGLARPAPAPRLTPPAPPQARSTLASCMARAVAGRGGSRGSPVVAPTVVDLDNLEGEFDDEEDGGAQDDSDVSVKSESYEDEVTAKVLKEMREAAGEVVAPTPMSALSDDAEELIKAFVPKLSGKATEAVVQFVIEHLRDTILGTGAQVAPYVAWDTPQKSVQYVGTLIVRLSGYVCQSPGELVYAAVIQAGTPMPCKTTVQGASALRALREIVSDHASARGAGNGAGVAGTARHETTHGSAGRASSLGSSGVLAQQMGVAGSMFPVFHMRGSGGQHEAGGPEALGQNIFESGLRVISNSDSDRAELIKAYAMLESGVAAGSSDLEDVYMLSEGCLFVRKVAGLVGTAHTVGASALSRGTSNRWVNVFLSEQCGKPSANLRQQMMLEGGYKHLDTVWQTVCSVRAGVEQVLQQEWRRLMRRESLDATELANACWYGRWRKFDLKKALTAEQTSGWLGAVKGDTQNLVSVWAIFTSFFTALTYMMTTLTHHWDTSLAFTLQLISSSAVSALEMNVPAAEIIELLPSMVFSRFDDAHRDFRTLGRALPVLAQTWAGFTRSDAHQRFREVVMLRTRQKADANSASELQKKIQLLEQNMKKLEDGKGGGGGGGGKGKANFVEKAVVDRFMKEHPGMCWMHHLKAACTNKDCKWTHGERIEFE